MIRIEVVTSGQRSGFVIAVDTTLVPTAAVVGQLYRDSPDGKPERWKAWLWPAPTTYPQRGHAVSAVSGKTPAKLEDALRRRHKAKGAWWAS